MRRPSRRQIRTLLRQVATLLEAGLPIDRALDLLARQTDTPVVAGLAARLGERLRDGTSLSDAMAGETAAFDRLDLSVARAAESSGRLPEAMARLAEHHERRDEITEQVRSALIYPAILVVAAVGAVAVLFTVVVPELAPLVTSSNAEPSGAAQAVFGISELLTAHGWWFLAALIAVAALLLAPAAQGRRDKILLSLPGLGPLWSKIETERWERAMAILLANGVPLPDAVAVAGEGFANQVLRGSGEHITRTIAEGRGLAVLMAECGYFPAVAVQLVRVGEESGSLDQMLEKAADYQHQETTQSVARMIALIEPVLILLLGLGVAAVILALLATVGSLNDALVR